MHHGATSPRLASIWLALAVALLSSLMPIGLPRTVAVGSAFNPATAAVALQPSRALPRTLQASTKPQDDPSGGFHEGAAVPIVQVHSLDRVTTPPVALRAIVSSPVAEQSAGLAGNPRGPPHP